jgi:hypothetical protein
MEAAVGELPEAIVLVRDSAAAAYRLSNGRYSEDGALATLASTTGPYVSREPSRFHTSSQ